MADCGIYQIRNIRNGKIYIGSSKNLDKRKYQHFRALKNKSHFNAYLQNAYNECSENFVFEILLICSEEMLTKYEQTFFDFLDPDYNLTKIAGRIELTDSILKKISESLTPEKRHSRSIKANATALLRGTHTSQRMTTEQNVERGRKSFITAISRGTHISQILSKDQKTARAKKGWETRRQKRSCVT